MDRARFPRDKACGEGVMPPGRGRRCADWACTRPWLRAAHGPLRGVTYQQRGQGALGCTCRFPCRRAALRLPGSAFDAPASTRSWSTPCARSARARCTRPNGSRGCSAIGRTRVGVMTTTTDEIKARVVIAADGLHSQMRSWAGLNVPCKRARALRARRALASRYPRIGRGHRDPRRRPRVVRGTGGAGRCSSCRSSRIESHRPMTARSMRLAARARASRRSGAPSWCRAHSALRTSISVCAQSRTVASSSSATPPGYDDPTTGDGIAIGMLLAERLAEHAGELLSGSQLSRESAAARYAADHANLVRERRRLTRLALFLARSPGLSRRAIRGRPTTRGHLPNWWRSTAGIRRSGMSPRETGCCSPGSDGCAGSGAGRSGARRRKASRYPGIASSRRSSARMRGTSTAALASERTHRLREGTDGCGETREFQRHGDVVRMAHVAIRTTGLNVTLRRNVRGDIPARAQRADDPETQAGCSGEPDQGGDLDGSRDSAGPAAATR